VKWKETTDLIFFFARTISFEICNIVVCYFVGI